MIDLRATIGAFFERSRTAFDHAAKDEALLAAVTRCAELIADAFRRGDKLLIAGNGGSAADAQHIAAEFLCRYKLDRAALPAIALTTDTSNLTAIGNDLGFDQIFERQVRGLGRKGDIFIGITTSGRSPNIITALKAAREMGLTTIGFTGIPGKAMSALCDVTVISPSDETALIQQIHITAAHAICEVVERQLFPAAIKS